MATSTRTQRPRAGATPAAAPRRASWRAGPARRAAQPRRVGLAGGWLQRREPEKSGVQKLIGGVGSALPGAGKGATKTTASAGKAKRGGQVGGLVMLTAAVGIAVKYRDQITSKLGRDQADRAAADGSGPVVVSPDIPGPPSAAPRTEPPAPEGPVNMP